MSINQSFQLGQTDRRMKRRTGSMQYSTGGGKNVNLLTTTGNHKFKYI